MLQCNGDSIAMNVFVTTSGGDQCDHPRELCNEEWVVEWISKREHEVEPSTKIRSFKDKDIALAFAYEKIKFHGKVFVNGVEATLEK